MTASLDVDTRARVLVEALPYIRRFSDAVVVVKYGGHAIEDRTSLEVFAQDIVLMRTVGMRPVVVHGGGPQISDLMGRLGMEPEFRDGLRVTDAETMDVARMVLVGKVNPEIVSAVNAHGALAVGLSGADAGLIVAAARHRDLGFVGDVARVEPEIVHRLLSQGLIPVIATIGAGEDGQAYNINADTVAGAVAEALGASKLVYLTDVEGIRADPRDPSTLIGQLDADELEAMVSSGALQGGMIPKATACLRAVRAGVPRAHVLDGRVPHVMLLELFSDAGVGTMIVPVTA